MTKSRVPLMDLECHFFTDQAYDVYAQRDSFPMYDPETTMCTFATAEGRQPLVCPQEGPIANGLTTLGEGRIERLGEHNITRMMISSAPGVESVTGQVGIDLCKHLNDTVYENMRVYPDSYFGTMILPVHDIEASIEEMRRNAERGFVCWHTHSNYNTADKESSLDDPEYEPLLAEAEKLGLLVYLHPTVPVIGRMMKYGYMFNAAALGFTIDTQITCLGLIVNGVFDRYPKLKMMLGHLGEALPFTFERMDGRLSLPFLKGIYKNELPVSKYFGRNIFVATSGNFCVETFELVRQLMGIDNICFASDFPFEDPEEAAVFMEKLDLTDEDREKLAYKNAARILGLDLE